MARTNRYAITDCALLLFLLTPWTPLAATVIPDCIQSAVPIDSITLTADLGVILNVEDEEGEIEWIIGGFNLTGNTPVITLDPTSITYTDAKSTLDTVTLSRLFDALALESVHLAVDSGLIATSQNPSNPVTIEVYIPTCVWVTGSGETTSYTNVSECTQGVRTITYSGSGTGWTGGITDVNGTTSCSTGTATIDGNWYLN